MTHYEVLGVPRSATPLDIKKAFRRRAREVHPDVGGTTAEFLPVDRAYKVLSNVEARRAYDATLDSPHRTQSSAHERAQQAPDEPVEPLDEILRRMAKDIADDIHDTEYTVKGGGKVKVIAGDSTSGMFASLAGVAVGVGIYLTVVLPVVAAMPCFAPLFIAPLAAPFITGGSMVGSAAHAAARGVIRTQRQTPPSGSSAAGPTSSKPPRQPFQHLLIMWTHLHAQRTGPAAWRIPGRTYVKWEDTLGQTIGMTAIAFVAVSLCALALLVVIAVVAAAIIMAALEVPAATVGAVVVTMGIPGAILCAVAGATVHAARIISHQKPTPVEAPTVTFDQHSLRVEGASQAITLWWSTVAVVGRRDDFLFARTREGHEVTFGHGLPLDMREALGLWLDGACAVATRNDEPRVRRSRAFFAEVTRLYGNETSP